MMIQSYDLNIEVSTHSALEFEYEAVAHLATDIREVLPYLNAVLKGGTYIADAPAYSWRKNNHKIAFWPDRIAADHLETREDAHKLIEELVAMVNDVWAKRDEIEPDRTVRENLQPLELFRLLPRTNCKECGESTCFNFALKLAAGSIELVKCRPLLSGEEYAGARAELESLLKTKRTLL